MPQMQPESPDLSMSYTNSESDSDAETDQKLAYQTPQLQVQQPETVTQIPYSSPSDYASRERVIRSHIREWYYQRKAGSKYMLWNPPGVILAKLEEYHWDTGPNYVPKVSDWWFEGEVVPEDESSQSSDWKPGQAQQFSRNPESDSDDNLGHGLDSDYYPNDWTQQDSDPFNHQQNNGNHNHFDQQQQNFTNFNSKLNSTQKKSAIGSPHNRAITNLVIGCSNWAVSKSREYPLENWVSVEDNDIQLFNSIYRAYELHEIENPELSEQKFENLRFIFTNPWLIHRFLPRESVDRVFINFCRDFKDVFRGVSDVIKVGGELSVITETENDTRATVATILSDSDPRFRGRDRVESPWQFNNNNQYSSNQINRNFRVLDNRIANINFNGNSPLSFNCGLVEVAGLRPPDKATKVRQDNLPFNQKIFVPKSPAARFHALDVERKNDIWAQIRGNIRNQKKENDKKQSADAKIKPEYLKEPVSFLRSRISDSDDTVTKETKLTDVSDSNTSESDKRSSDDHGEKGSKVTVKVSDSTLDYYNSNRNFYFCTQWVRKGASLPNSRFQNPGNPISVEKRLKSQRMYS